MLFQLASVPLSPRRVLCRSGECQQQISYTKQKWAQLLFFCNDLLVCFDRSLGRTVLEMKHLTERKMEQVMEKYRKVHKTKHEIPNTGTFFLDLEGDT